MFRNVYAILVSFILASLSTFAYAQDAQIQGQVLDTSGAAVPKAQVRVVDQQTSTERKVQTNDAGQYAVAGLTPGLYNITVEAPGFTPAGTDQIGLKAGQSAVFDFTLKIGGTSADIVVTAEKREESLQHVPVPVSVLDTNQLTANGQARLQDYFSSAPGLNLSPESLGNQNLTIRGITAGSFDNPTVGVMIDDAPYGTSIGIKGGNTPPDIDPGDLERIEILRGPQGTLYGDSSMGGLLKFVTKQPSTDGFDGRISMGSNGVHNGNEPGFDLRGSTNVPLSKTLAFRMSGFERQDPGYIDNPVLKTTGVNQGQGNGARWSALWKPSDPFSLRLSALYQNIKVNGSNEVDVPTTGYPQTYGLTGLQQNLLPGIGGGAHSSQVYSASLNYAFSHLDLASITGYGLNRSRSSTDFSSLYASLTEPLYGVTGVPTEVRYVNNTFNQEVRVLTSTTKRLDWLFGGFYSRQPDSEEFSVYAEDTSTGQVVAESLHYLNPALYSEYAGFATLTYHATDRWDIQAGVRETRYSLHDFAFYTFEPLFGATSPVFSASSSADGNAFTYLFTPRFNLSSNVMMYARLTSGYRPGGPNGLNEPQIEQGGQEIYKPDTTENYEVGLKGSFFRNRLYIDSSFYYIDWKNIQIFLEPSPTLEYFSNGSRAKSEGVELSVEGRPLRNLAVSGWFSYDDAVLTKDFPSDSTSYGVTGNRLPFTPRYSGNFKVNQEFRVRDGITGFLGGQLSYVGDRLGIFEGTPQRTVNPDYTKIDLRTGIVKNSWTANVYVNNVTDVRGQLSVSDFFPYAFYYIQPRTVGINITKTFAGRRGRE